MLVFFWRDVEALLPAIFYQSLGCCTPGAVSLLGTGLARGSLSSWYWSCASGLVRGGFLAVCHRRCDLNSRWLAVSIVAGAKDVDIEQLLCSPGLQDFLEALVGIEPIREVRVGIAARQKDGRCR